MAASVSIEMFARGAFLTVTLPEGRRSCFSTSRSLCDPPGLWLAHLRKRQMLAEDSVLPCRKGSCILLAAIYSSALESTRLLWRRINE
jgi:hypothetical protein